MSQERVERLESLLSRVQENRKRVRTPAGLGAPQPAVAAEALRAAREPAAAAPAVAEPPRSMPARPAPVQQAPAAQARSAPPAPPPKPQPAAFRAPLGRPGMPEAPTPRRPGQDRTATPLEMAVAGIDLPGAPASAREPVVAPQPPAAVPASLAPPSVPDGEIAALEIEPEPIREPARPIAQVVSRHSPQVDATFGAMLKRSLSLRPH